MIRSALSRFRSRSFAQGDAEPTPVERVEPGAPVVLSRVALDREAEEIRSAAWDEWLQRSARIQERR